MKLYIVRHAQSKRNTKEISEVDAELSSIGHEQAKRLGIYFKKVKVDRIYCSTLKRTKNTLLEILPYIEKIPVIYSDKIVEHKMGIYGENGKDDWNSYIKDALSNNKTVMEYKPKNGESLIDVYKRARDFYKKLLKNHSDEKILVVSHGTFGKYLILNALGLDISESLYFGLNNASVSTLEINKKGRITSFDIDDFHHIINYALEKRVR